MLVILAAVGLVLLPVIAAEWPREAARWLAAAAREHERDQQYDQALALLDQAIERDPESWQLYLQRAEVHRQMRQWEAGLADCDGAILLAPQERDVQLLRSQFLQHVGRKRDAVAQLEAARRDHRHDPPLKQAELLNALAYARAVADVELEDGLRDVEEALKIAGSRIAQWDTMGFLWFGRAGSARAAGEDERALEYLARASEHAESAYRRNSKRAQALAEVPRQAAEYQQRASLLKAHLVGILSQRVEVLEELGRAADAEQVRLRIEQLNEDGNQSMTVPLELGPASQTVGTTAAYLDTRGYLFYRLGDYRRARRDLQLAVQMNEALEETSPWLMEAIKHRLADMRHWERRRRLQQETLAVTRYHLMLALQALGLDEEAAVERAAILQLGREPNEELF